jgi:uncharacterized iron-regulated protein
VRIIKDLLAKGKELAIGMEMFERSQQPTLDRWSQGLLTEEEFLKESQWEENVGRDRLRPEKVNEPNPQTMTSPGPRGGWAI